MPKQYADEVRRFRAEIGNLAWAAPQDWMCEPAVIAGGKVGRETFKGTGLSVPAHQTLTVHEPSESLNAASVVRPCFG